MGLNIKDVISVMVVNPNDIIKKNLESKEKCWNHNFHSGSLTTKK